MARTERVVVTGQRDIDRALRRLESKVRNKAVRKASRNAAKKALTAYKQLVPVDSGAMRDAAKVRALQRNKSSRGALGASIIIDRKRLFALYESRTGRPPGKRKGDSEPFFYPTVVEFGLDGKEPESPLRKSVYGNEDAIRKIFLDELRKILFEVGREASAKSAALAAGATVYKDEAGRFQRTAGGFASKANVGEARAAGTLFGG